MIISDSGGRSRFIEVDCFESYIFATLKKWRHLNKVVYKLKSGHAMTGIKNFVTISKWVAHIKTLAIPNFSLCIPESFVTKIFLLYHIVSTNDLHKIPTISFWTNFRSHRLPPSFSFTWQSGMYLYIRWLRLVLSRSLSFKTRRQ